MKVKKNVLLLGVIILSGSLLIAQDVKTEKNALILEMSQARSIVFDVDNVFNPVEVEGEPQVRSFAPWTNVLTKIGEFVVNNYGENIKLWNAFSACQRVSETIRIVIQQAQTVAVTPVFAATPLGRPVTVDYQKIERTIRENIERLKGISKEELKEQEEILKGTTFYWNREQKNSVKSLLLDLIGQLKSIIDQVVNDFEKYRG